MPRTNQFGEGYLKFTPALCREIGATACTPVEDDFWNAHELRSSHRPEFYGPEEYPLKQERLIGFDPWEYDFCRETVEYKLPIPQGTVGLLYYTTLEGQLQWEASEWVRTRSAWRDDLKPLERIVQVGKTPEELEALAYQTLLGDRDPETKEYHWYCTVLIRGFRIRICQEDVNINQF